MQVSAPASPAHAAETLGSDVCRFRSAGRAVWPVRRAGPATSQGGSGAESPALTGGPGGGSGGRA
eukprot:6615581-Alexandrium_andersonii.AAC.1